MKFSINGSIGYGLGLGSANKKVGWFARLLGKATATNKDKEQPQPSEEGSFEGGLGGLGATYNIDVDIGVEELKELYELQHRDEEWTAARAATELKALGNGLYKALAEFASKGAEPWNRAIDVGYKVARHVKDEDLKARFEDRDREVADLENRLAHQRQKDEILDEDQRIRKAKEEKKEKAEK